jgi:formate dehydrogenase subunit gamma
MGQSAKTFDIQRGRRLQRRAWWVMAFGLILMLAPLTGFLFQANAVAEAPAAQQQDNPRSAFWREVRESAPGYTAASGPYTTNVLIQNGGENWRNLRQGPVATYAALILAAVVVALLAIFIFKGPDKLHGEPSGVRILRWTMTDRMVHWFTAILFIILAITGLSLLYGRAVLIPVIGKEAFAAYAALAMDAHNYLSIFFMAGLAVMLMMWMKVNIFSRDDIAWFKAGALFAKEHVPAPFTNGGEKLWFWILAVSGIAICVSGVVLVFPNLGWDRGTMQISYLVHIAGAIVAIAGALGHMYLGSVGVPGSLEGMTGGYVDAAWAKQHHRIWYEEAKGSGESAGPAGGGQPSTTGSR